MVDMKLFSAEECPTESVEMKYRRNQTEHGEGCKIVQQKQIDTWGRSIKSGPINRNPVGLLNAP